MLKICSKCGEEKDIEEFNKKGSEGRQTYCRECSKVATKQWYVLNSSRKKNQTNLRRKSIRDALNVYKLMLSCKICGENHPAVLDFHHREPTEKDFTISHALRYGYSKKKILEEIAKCDVLCSNCHRKLHYDEKRTD